MRQLKPLLIILVLSKFCLGQSLPEKLSETDFTIGKTINIKSTVLNENRTLNIYLPLSYSEDNEKKYPVIYLLDGSKNEDFIHISGLVQFGSFSWINTIPETIVVGIANVDRKKDFTYPSNNKLDQEEFPTTGKSKNFITFLEKELQPFIDANYKTTSIKTIIGQSLGGLLATEILFKKPQLFDNYIIVSPSLWWDDEKLLQNHQPETYTTNKSIYIAGGKEGPVMERTAKQLFEKISLSKKENTKLYYNFFEDKNHGDALHQAAYDAFEKNFKSVK